MKNKKIAIIAICSAAVIVLSVCLFFVAQAVSAGKTVAQLYLYGDMSEMTSKKDVRSVTATFKQGAVKVNRYATIKVQGSSSLAYDKKNYTIKFFKDPEHEKIGSVDVGWGKQNEYCLKANWIDKTHCRNVVTAKLASEVQAKYGIMEQAPKNGLIDGFPVEIYINDEYHGLYTWNIPKSAWQFNMDEENPNHIVLCGEMWEAPTLFLEEPNFDCWSVEVGPEGDETLEKLSRLSEFIMTSSDEDFKNNIDQYLDLDAVLNYYILVDFAHLPDNCGKNMLLVTYDGKVWIPSLYDLDTSWGVDWKGKELYDYENERVPFAGTNNLAKRVEENFAKELQERYFELREEILTKEHVWGLFESFDEQIGEEFKAREVERWGTEIPGYDLDQIEKYLDTVIDLLDQKYRDLGT